MSPSLSRFLLSVTTRGFLAAILFGGASVAHAELTILASIKPLALIAKEVAGGRAQIDVLLPIKASPHDYPLRVSDIRRLKSADIVLWIGPELETFLQRPLDSIPSERRFTSYDLPGIHWPRVDHQAKGHGHHHAHDPHLWLDPRNAIVIARALATRLGEFDKAFAADYQKNAEEFALAMTRLDRRLLAELASVKGRGFAVYHEGYLHFIERYGLNQLAYVTMTPERRPGARHLHQLRGQVKNKGYCLFIEPYYDKKRAVALAHELELQLAIIDPIGEEQVSSYRQLLEQMAETFLACLTSSSSFGER